MYRLFRWECFDAWDDSPQWLKSRMNCCISQVYECWSYSFTFKIQEFLMSCIRKTTKLLCTCFAALTWKQLLKWSPGTVFLKTVWKNLQKFRSTKQFHYALIVRSTIKIIRSFMCFLYSVMSKEREIPKYPISLCKSLDNFY